MIERKGIDPRMSINCVHLLLTSNEERAVPKEVGDTRFAVFKVLPTRKGDHAYWDRMFDELENGGYERLLHELLSWDISRRLTLPETAEGTNQLVESLEDVDAFVYDWLEGGEIPEASFRSDGFVDAQVQEDGTATIGKDRLYQMYHKSSDKWRRKPNAFGKRVRAILDVTDGRQGKHPRYWKLPELGVLRGRFGKHVGVELDWNLNEQWK